MSRFGLGMRLRRGFNYGKKHCMRKIQFVNDCLYHIYNRGTEKRNIFLDESYYFRFIHDLYEFNDANAVLHTDWKIKTGQSEICRGSASANGKGRELLVEIITFCLMPNHFHLVLRQFKEGGIAKFMQKLGTGYTMYFNQKNQRNGVLFQGKFKAILINKDNYFLPLVNYIHLNPLEFIEPHWKDEGIKDWKNANEFLENYRWSSHLDYAGIKNFPSVINQGFLMGYFRNKESYKNFVKEWLAKDLELIKETALE